MPPSDERFELVPNGFKITDRGLFRVDREVDLVRPEPRCAVVVDGANVAIVLEPGLADVPEVVEEIARIGKVHLHQQLTRSRAEMIRDQIDRALANLYVCRVVHRPPVFGDDGRACLGEWRRA